MVRACVHLTPIFLFLFLSLALCMCTTAEYVYHFVCLLRYRGQVTATELLSSNDSIKGDPCSLPSRTVLGDSYSLRVESDLHRIPYISVAYVPEHVEIVHVE